MVVVAVVAAVVVVVSFKVSDVLQDPAEPSAPAQADGNATRHSRTTPSSRQ